MSTFNTDPQQINPYDLIADLRAQLDLLQKTNAAWEASAHKWEGLFNAVQEQVRTLTEQRDEEIRHREQDNAHLGRVAAKVRKHRATLSRLREALRKAAEAISLAVAEIPDRFSPDDQPEMMLVTQSELQGIVAAHFESDPAIVELLKEGE